MRFVFYTHSLVSDWNHGNAHFLRGVMRELIHRDHEVRALEPASGWSRSNLISDRGPEAIARFHADFPELTSETYDADFDHEAALDGADVVVVHEWTDPDLVAGLGALRRNGAPFTLLFHDTHHRSASSAGEIAGLDLQDYDGVLAFGETLRQRYVNAGWGRSVFVWHEAADDRLFRPMPEIAPSDDLIWIGNWGDEERSAELDEFLIRPVAQLGLSATARGVRYPPQAQGRLAAAGIRYQGWIANADVPRAFAAHRVTMHIPRRPYVRELPGIPTIRVFEALACGIPLISAPWEDVEGLFRPGEDFLLAADGSRMRARLREVLGDSGFARSLAASGLRTIHARHTCRHRVDELFGILSRIGTGPVRQAPSVQEAAQ